MDESNVEKALGGSLVQTIVTAVVGARKAMIGHELMGRITTNADIVGTVHDALPDEAHELTDRIKAMPSCPPWLKAMLG